MTAPITLQPLATRLYSWMEPLNTGAPDDGLALAALATATTQETETADLISRDPGLLLRPAQTPNEAVRWLTLLEGVRRRPSESVASLRQRMIDGDGRLRGRNAALTAAARRTLSVPDGYVRVFPRTDPGDPGVDHFYDITVVTRNDQTPDPAATVAEMRSVKRFGFRLHHVLFDGVLIDEAPAGTKINDVAAGVKIDAVTMGDL